MKNWQFILIGFVNGIYFIFFGYGNQQPIAEISGVLLVSLSLLSAKDEWLTPGLAQSVTAAVAKPFQAALQVTLAHKQRVTSMYRLYQMAPAVYENQKRMEAVVQKIMLIDGRVEMWRRLAHIQSATSPSATGAAIHVEKNESIEVLSHTSTIDGDLSKVIARTTDLQLPTSEVELIVTDIGVSELSLQTLNDYLDGQVELDFWVAKKIINGRDLLVIPQGLVVEQTDVVWGAIEKVAQSYNHVSVLIHTGLVSRLEESRHPAGQRVIETHGIVSDSVDIV